MNARDGYDHQPDYDGHDEPRGSDPLLRRERNQLFFRHEGNWWQCGPQMPATIRLLWLAEEMRRDRCAKLKADFSEYWAQYTDIARQQKEDQ